MQHMSPEELKEVSDTRTLLACGAIAGPLYLAVGLAQALTREGFDFTQHTFSHLSNGDLGWIQISNFIFTGILVILSTVGMRRMLYPGRGSTWGFFMLAGFGAGLIGSGIFAADPAPGFPPGTEAVTEISRRGMLHFVFGTVGFLALIGACLVFAWRFIGLGHFGWAAYSAITGIAFLCAFATIASGATEPVFMLALYAAIAWVWVWHSSLFMHLLRLMHMVLAGNSSRQ